MAEPADLRLVPVRRNLRRGSQEPARHGWHHPLLPCAERVRVRESLRPSRTCAPTRRSFCPKASIPMQTGFHQIRSARRQQAGTGGFTPCDFIGLKYMFPEDKIDRLGLSTNRSETITTASRTAGRLFQRSALLRDLRAATTNRRNNDPAKLDIGNTFFCGERALLMTRSGWDKDALYAQSAYPRRPMAATPSPTATAIMLAGAGRIWSPNPATRGFENRRRTASSCIDDKPQLEQ